MTGLSKILHALACVFLLTLPGCFEEAARTEPPVPSQDDTPPVSEPPSAAGESPLPNVVWVCLDACRAQNLSCYGYERKTSPHLDKIAALGAVFENNFAQAFGTLSSVPSYMTGRYAPAPSLAPLYANWRFDYLVPPGQEQQAPAIFRQNGYHTAIVVGHPYFAPYSRLCRAFDEQMLLPAHSPEVGYAEFERVNEAVAAWHPAREGVPLFLYIHTSDTHFPHFPKEGYTQWIDTQHPDPGDSLAKGHSRVKTDEPFTKDDMEYLRGLHDGSIRYADDQFARLLDILSGLIDIDNTIIVVNADHGDALGEDGYNLQHARMGVTHDEVMRVPLIMAGPGIPAGFRTATMTENVDILPTLVEAAGLQTHAQFHGMPLTLLWNGERSWRERDYVLGIQDYPGNHDVMRHCLVLRGGRYKYEKDTFTGEERLWSVPDTVAGRTDRAAARPEDVARMAQTVARVLMPLLEATYARPVEVPLGAPFSEPVHVDIVPAARELPHTDSESDGAWFVEQGLLVAHPSSEEVPPVELLLTVPEGTYDVAIHVRPGTVLKVLAPGTAEPVPLAAPQKGDIVPWDASVRLGVIEASDGRVPLTLLPNTSDLLCEVHSFTFTRVEEGSGGTDLDREEFMERGAAMGYL